jgi:hypothetical protein
MIMSNGFFKTLKTKVSYVTYNLYILTLSKKECFYIMEDYYVNGKWCFSEDLGSFVLAWEKSKQNTWV